MNLWLKATLLGMGLLAVGSVTSAEATEWRRGTVHGGHLSRSIVGNGLVYSGQTTRIGPNGGIYTSNSTCVNGIVDRCRRSYSATGPAGRSVSGHRASAHGPYRTRSAGIVTGPRGNSVVGVRRHWR